MNDSCLKIVKKCLEVSRVRYNALKTKLDKENAFDYEMHKVDFFNIQKVGVLRLLEKIVAWEKNDLFMIEVMDNKNNERYFDRFDHLLSRHFEFISSFNVTLDIYFNFHEDAQNSFESLQFFYPEVEIDPEKYRLDSEEQAKLRTKMSKKQFIRAIEIYHISVFETFETFYKMNVPQYQKKLLRSNYTFHDTTINDHISLKYGIDNEDIICRIYKVLVDSECLNCSQEEFQIVFYPGNKQVQWIGSQKQLMLMFHGFTHKMKLNNSKRSLDEVLANRFKNKPGFKPFKVTTLRTEFQGIIIGENVKKIDKILSFLKDLSS